MTFIVIVVLIGLLPAIIASNKGRSFLGWWLYGMALFIIALPHALMLKEDRKALDGKALMAGNSKRCEHCAEIIRREARVCRFCGRDVAEARPDDKPAFEYLG